MVENSEYAVHGEWSLKPAVYYSGLDSTAAAAVALQFLLPVFNNTASFPIAPTSTRLSDSCHGDKQHQEEQQPDGKKDKNCTIHCARSPLGLSITSSVTLIIYTSLSYPCFCSNLKMFFFSILPRFSLCIFHPLFLFLALNSLSFSLSFHLSPSLPISPSMSCWEVCFSAGS